MSIFFHAILMKIPSRFTHRCHTSPYSRVYNQMFKVAQGDKRGRVSHCVGDWIRKRLAAQDRSVQERILFSSHVATLCRTQRLGQHVDMEVMELVRRDRRLAEIAAGIKLRKLQWRILDHLWRPGGSLMLRQGMRFQEEMAREVASRSRDTTSPTSKGCSSTRSGVVPSSKAVSVSASSMSRCRTHPRAYALLHGALQVHVEARGAPLTEKSTSKGLRASEITRVRGKACTTSCHARLHHTRGSFARAASP